jgi:hypothetical protein
MAPESVGRVEACRRVRSTLLFGSLRALRSHGHGEAYLARVDRGALDAISAIGVPQWLPMEIAEAHYAACDALRLSVEEMLAIGASVAPTAASGVSVILQAARTTGATPWTVLERAPKYWKRMYDGSALVITKRGPKDASIAIVRNSLARHPYWRIGLRGIIGELARALSSSAVVREVVQRTPSPESARDEVTYALAWV